MRLAQVVRTLALCSLLATTALVYAQDQREEPKPAQDETKSPKQNEGKPAKPDENKREDKATKRVDKTTKQEDKTTKQEDKTTKQDTAKPAKQGNSAGQSGHDAQRAAKQRGAHIPDDKFRAHFGHQHTFVIHQTTTVQGQPGFQYGGYSFMIIDAWPVGWAYTDECYVDYIDGDYFLFDLLHPGVQVALVVVF